MTELEVLALAGILVLGIGAQWLAWRFHLPSILLLLVLGLLAGPLTGFLDPDRLFGPLLLPLVSVSVAIILFEGGLSLRFSELTGVGRVVRNLISLGVLVTWATTTIAAYLLLGLTLDLALLLGAILVVTGPTVIIPLLRHVRPAGRVGAIARWEGIVNDPIGAILAVLVFEAILAGGFGAATAGTLLGVLNATVAGVGTGIAGAGVLILVIRRHLMPDFLLNPAALTTLLAVVAVSDRFQAQSGLLAATVMGIALANQRLASVAHIAHFKESLRVLLLGGLFVVLGARLQPADLRLIDGSSVLFVAILMLVVRPLAVALSTRRSPLTRNERLFLIWMAPRGVVAAAVSSVFALVLVEAGRAEAGELVPITFLVIAVTVAIYGLTAAPVARRLGLAEPEPQGLLIIGAHAFAREIAGALQKHGFRVLLADTNRVNVRAARSADLTVFHGNVLADPAAEQIDLAGIGRLLPMTPNDEVNALAALHFADLFERSAIFQLVPAGAENEGTPIPGLRGRALFGRRATYQGILRRMEAGAIIREVTLSEPLDVETFRRTYGEDAIPLFVIRGKKKLVVWAADQTPASAPGDILIALAKPVKEDSAGEAPLPRKT